MSIKRATLKLAASSAGQFTHTIERESSSQLQDHRGFSDQTVIKHMPTPISRNSELVGFERGRRRLQPYVGPKEF
jgi:hypothetical protein